jgi:nitrite reductase/ring-hydroxylating ferredoxin subunit
MGEDLLAFRDSNGRVGIVEPHCPHRGANLYYGRNEDCGIRCAFHGWKFDVEGNCVDLPTSPPDSTYKDTIKLLAYPVREWADIVWVYMGPRDTCRSCRSSSSAWCRPRAATSPRNGRTATGCKASRGRSTPPTSRSCTRSGAGREDQARDLPQHLGDRRRPGAAGSHPLGDGRPAPKFAIAGHDTGLVIGAARKTDSADKYWRHLAVPDAQPCAGAGRLPGDVYHGQCWVPVDDVNCWIYTYSWLPDRPFTNSEREKYANGLSLHAEVDAGYVPVRNRQNDYMLDREKQKTRASPASWA